VVFSSHIFVYYFLPLALLLYYCAPRRARLGVLTLLSYLFYGWANPAFVFLMFGSTVVDYFSLSLFRPPGSRIPLPPSRGARDADLPEAENQRLQVGGERSRRQRLALALSIATNLSALGFFKYFNFAVDSANAIAQAMGFDGPLVESTLRVVLPLGISFYTFQSMSYTIDVYRGHARALRNFVDFACYVSMFPQLVAGPIIRFSDVADQLRRRRHSLEKFARGAALVSLGLGKKILLANPCGKVADATFEAGSVVALDAWYGVVAYSMQIYFDFSGYSDMAIGLGLMLGFVFAKNFDSPYKAESITDFWRRWHISLSNWLRDYLYKPLGGNRRGPLRTYLNLGAVMLLGGLWHGAAWKFVIWGGFHGLLLAGERARGKASAYRGLARPLRVAITFALVTLSWVFFRASDLAHAVRYLGAMVGTATQAPAAGLIGGLIYQPYYLITLGAALVVAFAAPQSWDWTRQLPVWKVLVCVGVLWVALVMLNTQAFNPFIYFIF
jgi:alginate O-acetyltransferase complex protein AlgI